MFEPGHAPLDPIGVLARYPSLLAPVGPIEPLGNHGGHSGSRLWRFGSRAGPLVLRAWPVDVSERPRLLRIHAWLDELADLPIIPVPFRALDRTSLVLKGGRPWELARWLDGEPADTSCPRSEQVDLAFGMLGRLHRRLATHAVRGTSPGAHFRLGEIDRLVDRDVVEATELPPPASWPLLPVQARRWLTLVGRVAPIVRSRLGSVASLEIDLQPVLRDARPAHFLFADGRLTGLVDYGAMGVESVAADLARMMYEWFPRRDPLRQRALAAYANVRPLQPAELRLWPALEDAACILVGAHWIRTARHATPPRIAEAQQGFARGLSRLVELVDEEGLTDRPGGEPGATDSSPLSLPR